ncbi:MAG: hypothetical protein WC426_08090 [Sulfuriferula sp.]
MHKPYQPVPRFYLERLTIAAFCNETMNLHWQDEATDMHYIAQLLPIDTIEENDTEYLIAHNEQGEVLKIRLDLIHNFPTPVK